jgi:hypothetical protein
MTGNRRILAWAPLSILVLATTAAAGLSIGTAPASTAAPSIGSSPTAPRLWSGVNPALPSSRSDPNRRAAIIEAQRLLQRVIVPAVWTRVSKAPNEELDDPGSAPATTNLVDLYQWWTTAGPWPAVRSFIVAHRPSGSSGSGSGTTYQAATIVAIDVSDWFPTTGTRFNTRQILFEVAPLADGAVGIRVDAQVIWYPTRPVAERVPAGAAKVRATVFRQTGLTDDAPVVLATATFTSPLVVARLARKVDSLPLALPGVRHCPNDSGTDPQLTLTFSGPPGIPVVVVHDNPNGCGSVTFTRGTTSEPTLTDDGLFSEVESLFGVSAPVVQAP